MKVIEMFTGIGSQAKALKRISAKRNINIEISNTCEWNIHAIAAYHYIHNNTPVSKDILDMNKDSLLSVLSKLSLSLDGKDAINSKYLGSLDVDALRIIYNSILKNNNLLNITEVRGTDIPNDIDLLTYSFPCQDLSNVGSFHGYKNGIDRDKNTRSGLLWEIERILEEKKELGQTLPKFLLLENVTALEAARHKGNFEQWQSKLIELGYINKTYKLNAENFGIPQYRNRLIMLSVHIGEDGFKKELIEQYWETHDLNKAEYIKTLKIKKRELKEFLKTDYSDKKYMKEALEAQPNATPSRLKIWDKNSKIIDKDNFIAQRVQTITTKQDRHPNSGNIYFNPKNDRSRYRFLTPRECFILMGFYEKDYDVLVNNNFITRGKSLFFSRDILYKLAGNSIVVDVLEYVFDQMVDIDLLVKTDENYKLKELVKPNIGTVTLDI